MKAGNASTKLNSVLSISGFSVFMNIGVGAAEREVKQEIVLDIDVYDEVQSNDFALDDYQDVVCYDKVITQLLVNLSEREFKLIESLAEYIINFLTNEFFQEKKLQVVVKKAPKISGFLGFVKYTVKNF